TGIKGEVMGGTTTYGDDERYKVNLTAGTPFAGGRGHMLFAGETAYTRGIAHSKRPWSEHSYSIISNPSYAADNGQPRYQTVFDTGLAVATRGGLILSCDTDSSANGCPLRGTQFLAGGT